MLPKLRETVANLDDLGALAAKLPIEDQQKVATLVSGAMPAVNELCDKVLALPTVAGVARPLVESVRAKLGSIAGT